MDDWERKSELLDAMEADDDEYNSFDIMLMLGCTTAIGDAIIEEVEI